MPNTESKNSLFPLVCDKMYQNKNIFNCGRDPLIIKLILTNKLKKEVKLN
jgi:hypothetical protein